jgi:Fe-S cluster assembly iron-binding protein IscA
MSRTCRTVVAALTGLLVAATAACGPDDDPDAGRPRWPSTSSPVDADGLVWASGDQVHLPDGSTIETEGLAGSYVVAGPGVWYASAEVGELEGNESPLLRLATADGVEELDAHPETGSLTATPDGRWLAFIDRLDDGAGPAEAVVVDTTSGEEVVRSSEGLVPSETGGADWTDLYEDAPVSMLGVVDGTAYVQGLSTLVTYDLATGESTSDDLDWSAIRSADWYAAAPGRAPLELRPHLADPGAGLRRHPRAGVGRRRPGHHVRPRRDRATRIARRVRPSAGGVAGRGLGRRHDRRGDDAVARRVRRRLDHARPAHLHRPEWEVHGRGGHRGGRQPPRRPSLRAAAREHHRPGLTARGLSVPPMSAMVEGTHSPFGRRAMLALTENVTEIVKKLAEEVPGISALRISAESDGQSLSVSPADQAAPHDQVLEQDGATVYVDETASVMLADKILDGGVDEEGNIQFALGQQA